MTQFQNAIKYDEKHLGAYLDLADIFDQQRKYSDAIDWLLKATRQFPMHYLPYKELARVYSHVPKTEEAISNYEEAIKRVPDEDAWLRNLYSCRIKRLQNKFAEAIQCFQDLKLPSNVDPTQIIYDVGVTYVASKNKSAALAQYELLKQRNSTFGEDLLRQIDTMR
jgi:tetratricopeptide (TPR) repeat protein